MQFPQLNINGTDGADLLSQYGNAVALVRAARDVTAAAAPHGRDYQTMGLGTYTRAAMEHRERMRKLNSVLAELEALQLNVAEQIDMRIKTGRSTPSQIDG